LLKEDVAEVSFKKVFKRGKVVVHFPPTPLASHVDPEISGTDRVALGWSFYHLALGGSVWTGFEMAMLRVYCMR